MADLNDDETPGASGPSLVDRAVTAGKGALASGREAAGKIDTSMKAGSPNGQGLKELGENIIGSIPIVGTLLVAGKTALDRAKGSGDKPVSNVGQQARDVGNRAVQAGTDVADRAVSTGRDIVNGAGNKGKGFFDKLFGSGDKEPKALEGGARNRARNGVAHDPIEEGLAIAAQQAEPPRVGFIGKLTGEGKIPAAQRDEMAARQDQGITDGLKAGELAVVEAAARVKAEAEARAKAEADVAIAKAAAATAAAERAASSKLRTDYSKVKDASIHERALAWQLEQARKGEFTNDGKTKFEVGKPAGLIEKINEQRAAGRLESPEPVTQGFDLKL